MTPRPRAAGVKRRPQLGLSESEVTRAQDLAVAALTDARLTRAELLAVWDGAGLMTAGGRGYHLIAELAQRGVLCLGPLHDGGQAFVLLDSWVPEPRRPGREEALGELALRYFRSHGPATVKDLIRWTGLAAADARDGTALARDQLDTITVDGTEYLLDLATPQVLADHRAEARDIVLLPGFDEIILGYADGLDLVDLGDALTLEVLRRSVPLNPPDALPVPNALRRVDGESVYLEHATQRFTSAALLQAEDRLVGAALQVGALVVPEDTIAAAIEETEASTGRVLNDGQRALARRFAAGGHVLEAGIGPAGAGKTTAMAAFARAVLMAGGRVLGLAPSAAAVLGEELGVEAETLHNLLHAHDGAAEVSEHLSIDGRTVLLVDEAGMAGTPELDHLLSLAARHGAAVRLLGDPAQLQAVGAGGVLRRPARQGPRRPVPGLSRLVTTQHPLDADPRRELLFADLIFFHLGLRRFVVFELKVGPVEPEHLGKLSFYVTAVDEQLRRPEHGDGPTIGILLAGYRDDVVVEYALRTVDAPLAVATYTTDRTLPADVRAALPSSADLADLITDVTDPE